MQQRRFSALTTRIPRWASVGLTVCVFALLLARWIDLPTTSPIVGDAKQNFRMAYNLSQHGTLSLDNPSDESGKDREPTNYREPVPPLVLGLYLKGVQYLAGVPAEYFATEGGGRLAKFHNILWAAVLSASVFGAIVRLTGLGVLGGVGALLVGWNADLDTLYTELPAAALLALFSFLGVLAIQMRRLAYCLICGLAAGALILTKGAFLYIVIALGTGAALWLARDVRELGLRRIATGLALFAVGAGALVGPWVARNYYYLGAASITERGGVVLMMRALKNQMTWTEYIGSFYVWAPWQYRERIGQALGFTPADLMKGGRLQRLNRAYDSDFAKEDKAAERAGEPEKALTYYARARAERLRITTELQQKGDPHPESAGDLELRKRAMQLILDHPVNHLIATAPFLWRGAALSAPLLAVFTVIALMLRRRDIVVYTLPALTMLTFYAFASYNIPRYNFPADPVVVVAAMATFQSLLLVLYRRMRPVLHRYVTGIGPSMVAARGKLKGMPWNV